MVYQFVIWLIWISRFTSDEARWSNLQDTRLWLEYIVDKCEKCLGRCVPKSGKVDPSQSDRYSNGKVKVADLRIWNFLVERVAISDVQADYQIPSSQFHGKSDSISCQIVVNLERYLRWGVLRSPGELQFFASSCLVIEPNVYEVTSIDETSCVRHQTYRFRFNVLLCCLLSYVDSVSNLLRLT